VSAVDCRQPPLRTIPPGSHRLLAVDPPPRSTKPGRRLPIPLMLVLKEKGGRLPRRRNATTTARAWAGMPDLRRVNDDVLALLVKNRVVVSKQKLLKTKVPRQHSLSEACLLTLISRFPSSDRCSPAIFTASPARDSFADHCSQPTQDVER
jgi:hypothetical protein